MNIIQLLHTCIRSILRNRMRSLLTSLGVIIGVGSVIIMVALGEGSQRSIEEQMSAMGTNLLIIYPQGQMNRSGQRTYYRYNSFTKKDVQKLKDESTFAAAISGVVYSSANVTGSEGNANVQIQGVEPGALIAQNLKVNAGVFFDEEDLILRNRVAVLGRTTAKNLFGEEESALSERIRVESTYFTVIGLLESKGATMFGGNRDDVILIPLDTVITRLTNSRNIDMICMSVISKEYMEAAQKEAELILRESRNIREGADSDFSIMNQADMIEKWRPRRQRR